MLNFLLLKYIILIYKIFIKYSVNNYKSKYPKNY